jgi:drug/metabolite transporter (DMT)-like permease
MAIIFAASLLSVYAWNGRLLEVVDVKTAKKNWTYSVLGMFIGVLIFLVSDYYIITNPELAMKLSYARDQSIPNLFWLAVVLLLLGGFVIGFPTQLYKLEFKKYPKEYRRRVFYMGLALLGLGLLLFALLLMPGSLLPA